MKEFKKITYEEEYGNTEYDVNEHLTDKVLDMLGLRTFLYRRELIESLYDCESPIEQLMAIELHEVYNIFSAPRLVSNIEVIGLSNQVALEVDGKKYRPDFIFELAFYKDKKPKRLLRLIIECDGHDFHEKTKEQVTKDNERTRALQSAGYEVLRFSGSEVYNNQFKCGEEVKKFIVRKYYDFMEEQE